MRTRTILGLLMAALLISSPAAVVASEGGGLGGAAAADRGGVLLTWATSHEAPDTGRVGVEADLRVGGTPLLIVGHVTGNGQGIGPKVQHNLGPIVLYGHTLFGTFETGSDAMADSQIRHGTGVEIPVRDGVFVRVGLEHTPGPGDSDVTASSVGVGFRW